MHTDDFADKVGQWRAVIAFYQVSLVRVRTGHLWLLLWVWTFVITDGLIYCLSAHRGVFLTAVLL